jgi:hypothetical protein
MLLATGNIELMDGIRDDAGGGKQKTLLVYLRNVTLLKSEEE